MELTKENIQHLTDAMNRFHDFLMWTCKEENKKAWEKSRQLQLAEAHGTITACIEMLSDFTIDFSKKEITNA